MKAPLVSIITPTRGRDAFLPSIYACVMSQDWPSIEWLICDDSQETSKFFRRRRDARITYYHNSEAQTVGAKRNELVSRSSGQYIAHFDDDDYYAPNYISHMISALRERGADLVKLNGIFIYDKRYNRYFYWNQSQEARTQYVCWPNHPLASRASTDKTRERAELHRLGYGFSYVYSRRVWESIKFPDVTYCEDLQFMTQAAILYPVAFLEDRQGICLHVIHASNLSGCFPQYILPNDVLGSIFPEKRIT